MANARSGLIATKVRGLEKKDGSRRVLIDVLVPPGQALVLAELSFVNRASGFDAKSNGMQVVTRLLESSDSVARLLECSNSASSDSSPILGRSRLTRTCATAHAESGASSGGLWIRVGERGPEGAAGCTERH